MHNVEVRDQINNYFLSKLEEKATAEESEKAVLDTLREFPVLIDFYIRFKEERKDEATARSEERVARVEDFLIRRLKEFANFLASQTPFYKLSGNTWEEARERAMFLKDVIENKGGWRLSSQGRIRSDVRKTSRSCSVWCGSGRLAQSIAR